MTFSNRQECCTENLQPLPSPSGNTECDISGCDDWQVCLANMLSVFIGDWDGDFTQDRLCQILLVAAFHVAADLSCSNCSGSYNFTVNIVNKTVSLDLLDPSNAVISNLVIYKAACIIDQGAARYKAARDGVSAKCGPVSLSVNGGSSSFNAFFKYGPCSAYTTLLEQCCFKGPIADAAYARAVLSTFVNDSFRPCVVNPSCDGSNTGSRGNCCNNNGV